MRGIKPFKLGMLTRPFQWGPQHHLGVSVLAYFPFDEPGGVFSDVEMWDLASNVLGRDGTLDMGIPKSRAEFLVAGDAFQPGGEQNITLPVSVQVGSLRKSISVIGDRFWIDGQQTKPIPFSRMGLGWERAFGGEGYDLNPRGKGFAPYVDDEGREIHPLPNLEQPHRLITKPKDRPAPAGFGPIDFTWPQRFAKAGTYDKRWLETRYPGFAEDMDWRIWNAAAEDQQQEEPFVGDEVVRFTSLHPELPTIEARLPGLRARVFLTKMIAGQETLEELEVRLTTVWCFPNQQHGICIWQGATKVLEDDASDVTTVMIAAERLGEPKDPEHYRGVLTKRRDPEQAHELLNDIDLMPEGMTGFSPEVEKQMELLAIEGLRLERKRAGAEQSIAESRERLEALGLDPDEHGARPLPPPEDVPTLAELPEFEAKKRAEAAEIKKEMDAIREQEFEKLAKAYEELGLDFEEVREEIVSPRTGPPTFTADGQRKYFRELADQLVEIGQPVDEVEFFATDEETYEGWKEREAQGRQMYQVGAHHQYPAPPKDPEESAKVRAWVEDRHRRQESFAGLDLTGADLSGMDLAGADFSDAFLESVSFENANLSGAIFARTVLSHANLTGARLRGASCVGANFGKAKLVAVDVGGQIDLTNATLWGADLTRANLEGAILIGAQLLEATIDMTNFARIDAKNMVFHKQTLSGCSFVGAHMPATVFVECSMPGIDFSGANLFESVLLDTNAAETRWVNADLSNLRVVMGTVLDGAVMLGCRLDRANLRGTSMIRADLGGAHANGADFSEAILREANLYRVVARESLWMKTDLRGAMMVSIDLMRSLLQKADIRGTDLRGANLYGADFALVHSDEATNVTDAIQLKVRTIPLREQPSDA